MERALALAWQRLGTGASQPDGRRGGAARRRGGGRGLARRVRRARTPRWWRWRAAGAAARGAHAGRDARAVRAPGKQPPCAEAIVAAGVRPRGRAPRADPNPAAGGGADVLRARRHRGGSRSARARRSAAQNAVFFHRQRNARPALRGAQAGDLARRADRRPGRPVALDLGAGGARLRALAARRVRRHRASAVGPRGPTIPRLTVRGTIVPRVARRGGWCSTGRHRTAAGPAALAHRARDADPASSPPRRPRRQPGRALAAPASR